MLTCYAPIHVLSVVEMTEIDLDKDWSRDMVSHFVIYGYPNAQNTYLLGSARLLYSPEFSGRIV